MRFPYPIARRVTGGPAPGPFRREPRSPESISSLESEVCPDPRRGPGRHPRLGGHAGNISTRCTLISPNRTDFFNILISEGFIEVLGSFSIKAKYILTGGALLAALALLVTWAILTNHKHRNWLETRFEKALKKTQLVNSMRTDLLESAEAEKSSVMADMDDESKDFSQQSEQASAAVEKARQSLAHVLDEEKSGREMGAFDQFSNCWVKLQEIDR
jgi:hypothetical protein